MHVYTNNECVLCFLFYLILEMNWVETEAYIEMDDEGDAAKWSALIGRVKFPCEVPRSCPRTTRQTSAYSHVKKRFHACDYVVCSRYRIIHHIFLNT